MKLRIHGEETFAVYNTAASSSMEVVQLLWHLPSRDGVHYSIAGNAIIADYGEGGFFIYEIGSFSIIVWNGIVHLLSHQI